MIIFADSWNLNTQKLSNLLGEKVVVMKTEEKLSDDVKKVLNCDLDIDKYPLDFSKDNEQPKNALAVFPKNKVNATNFKLAQQIAGVPIIAEFTQAQRVTQSNDAFESDFKRIDSMFANCATNSAIWNALESLERRARNLRNAKAMRKIAVYYDKAMDSGTAFACRREANEF